LRDRDLTIAAPSAADLEMKNNGVTASIALDKCPAQWFRRRSIA
jgi:hypothetical protein